MHPKPAQHSSGTAPPAARVDLPMSLADLADLAERAGAVILPHHAPDVVVDTKADDSPVTAADRAAHAYIAQALAAATPDIPQLSEEGRDIPWSERRNWTRYWLIDPLDGTREFIAGNGEFTVNIALIEHGWPVMGVVHVPLPGRTYVAAAGHGAFQREVAGALSPIRTRTPASDPPTVLVSRSHPGPDMEAALQRLGAHTRRAAGSALKFGELAAGMADIYPRLSPTMEWDTAAGHCVIEAAGGCLQQLDGTPLRYNQRTSLVNPGFVAVGDPATATPWLTGARI